MEQSQKKFGQHYEDQNLFEEELPESFTEPRKTEVYPLEDEKQIQKTKEDSPKNPRGCEPDLTAVMSHVQQLLTELQMKRQGTTLLAESTKCVEFRLEEARNAARRAVLAEEFAKSTGEAAQRLAKETEIATREAAAARPLIEAKTLEIEALQAEIRSLRSFVDGVSRREADDRALRASEDAAKKLALANVCKIYASIAEVQKRQRSLELSMESLEGEVKAAASLLDQEREERAREKLASVQEREQLKKASEHIAALTAEVGAMRARAGAGLASHTRAERSGTPNLTTQHQHLGLK